MSRAIQRALTTDTLVRPLLDARCRKVILLRRRVLRGAGREPIHDLRVATRRLQEALDFLAPSLPARETDRLSRRARRIRRCLGRARNADVLYELVGRMATFLPAEGRRALRTALLHGRRIPRRGRTISLPGIRRRAEAVLRRVNGEKNFSFTNQAARALNRRFSEISRAERSAQDGSAEALHRLRIAVKRYRYLLEILAEARCDGAEVALRQAKRLQECLGNLHDLDLLLERSAGVPDPVHDFLRRHRAETLAEARALLRRAPPREWRSRLHEAIRGLP